MGYVSRYDSIDDLNIPTADVREVVAAQFSSSLQCMKSALLR